MEAISVSVRRGAIVEARHRVHAVAVRGGRDRRVGRRSGARLLPPLEREADPGAAARPRAARSRRRGDRDRVRVTPRRAGTDRGRPTSARSGRRQRGRSRVRRPGGAPARSDPPQLLRQARGLPRAAPGAGLGDEWLPARGASCSTGASESRSRRRPELAGSVDPDRGRRLRCRHVRARRSSGWRRVQPAAGPRWRATGCSAAMRAHPELVGGLGLARHRPHAHRIPVGSRRAAQRASSAPSHRTARATR